MARLIDAEHLKRWILARWERIDPRSEYPLKAIDILDQIDREDTIDAEPVRHGKWIKENIVLTSLPPKSRWHCSECGSIRDGYDGSVLTPYCPNCGAKMDKETMLPDYVYSTRRIKNLIEEAPTIDAEPVRHGHWIESQNSLKCSECGYYPLSRVILRGEKIWEADVNEDLLYCPYCGAKMDEVENIQKF